MELKSLGAEVNASSEASQHTRRHHRSLESRVATGEPHTIEPGPTRGPTNDLIGIIV